MNEVTTIEEPSTTRLSNADWMQAEADAAARQQAETKAAALIKYHNAILDGSFEDWSKAMVKEICSVIGKESPDVKADQALAQFAREAPARVKKMNADLLEMKAKSEELRAIADDSKPEKSLAWKIKLATDSLTREHREALNATVANDVRVRGQQAEIERLQGKIASLPAWITD